MSVVARTLYVPGAEARVLLQQRVQAALDAWSRDWVRGWNEGASPVVELDGLDVDHRSSMPKDYELLQTTAGRLWSRHTEADRLNLGRAIAGTELMPRSIMADDWIAAVIQAGWVARNRAVCSCLLSASLPPSHTSSVRLPDDLYVFGSGAVRIRCDSLGLNMIGDSGVWKSLPPPVRSASALPGITSLDRALGRSSLQLQVMLGSVDIELPKLLDLQPGDVLRLPQKLDHYAAVLCGGKPVARALLGESAGQKGAQLFAL